MYLSDNSILKYNQVVSDKGLDKSDWIDGNWSKIGTAILIEPYYNECLGTCSYDLTVGDEYVSLRDPKNIRNIKAGEKFEISPKETVLILTREYIGLPKSIVGFVVPRARWLFEGTSLNATRVDPTWYGKLLISFTNHGNSNIELIWGEKFCTCMFTKLDRDVDNELSKGKIDFLGRENIGRILFNHVVPFVEKTTNQVILSDIDSVVKEYGPPYDVVRGALFRIKDEAETYMSGDLGPDIVKEASQIAMADAYSKLFKICIALLGILGTSFVALLVFIYKQVFN